MRNIRRRQSAGGRAREKATTVDQLWVHNARARMLWPFFFFSGSGAGASLNAIVTRMNEAQMLQTLTSRRTCGVDMVEDAHYMCALRARGAVRVKIRSAQYVQIVRTVDLVEGRKKPQRTCQGIYRRISLSSVCDHRNEDYGALVGSHGGNQLGAIGRPTSCPADACCTRINS